MTKKDKNAVVTQASDPATSESNRDRVRDQEASDALATIQVASSLSTSGYSDQESIILKKASAARYRAFASADPTESVLVTLSVGLENAAMKSLQHAASTQMLDARSEELRNATRAAKMVAESLEALDRHRGRDKQSVTVGQVTVETGGQAIVGNVNSEGTNKPQPRENPADQSRENP